MRVSKLLVDSATVSIALFALVVTGLVVRDRLAGTPGLLGEERAVENWETYLPGARWIGPPDAEHTIVEFGDYECPACRAAEPHLRAVLRKYPGKVAIAYRHWPLTNHPNAYAAARAAECGADQGSFEVVHSGLLRLPELNPDAYLALARDVGVPDIEAFADCIRREDPVPAIEAGIRAATDMNAFGTPALIVNGRLTYEWDSLRIADRLQLRR